MMGVAKQTYKQSLYPSMKASIATIEFGNTDIQGLMTEDGLEWVSVPQICSLFQFPIKHASRDIKVLLGESFQFPKMRTTLNPKAVNVVSLLDFEKLLAKLDRSGNKVAQDMRDDLVGLSLKQLFADAFNKKFEKEDRQKFLKARVAGVVSRRSLTDAIRDWMDETGNQDKNLYASITNQIYTRLFGGDTNEMRKLLGIANGESIRDNLHPKALKAIDNAEDYIAVLIDDGSNPIKAVSMYFNSPFVKKIAV